MRMWMRLGLNDLPRPFLEELFKQLRKNKWRKNNASRNDDDGKDNNDDNANDEVKEQEQPQQQPQQAPMAAPFGAMNEHELKAFILERGLHTADCADISDLQVRALAAAEKEKEDAAAAAASAPPPAADAADADAVAPVAVAIATPTVTIQSILGGTAAVAPFDAGRPVSSLQGAVAAFFGVPEAKQLLIFDGRELKPEAALGSYRGLEAGKTIHLVTRAGDA